MAVKVKKSVRKAKRAGKPKATKRFSKHGARMARRTKRKTATKLISKRVVKKTRRTKRKTKKSQTGSYRRVWSGTAVYTRGRLTKADLCINDRGKVVSKKKHILSKRMFGIKKWLKAAKKTRKNLGTTGFVLINRGSEGKALYKTARALYKK